MHSTIAPIESKNNMNIASPTFTAQARSPATKSDEWKNSSRPEASPLPCKGAFRLQPRKIVKRSSTRHYPSQGVSASSRGRKRGAQKIVAEIGNSVVGISKEYGTPGSPGIKNGTEALLKQSVNRSDNGSPFSMHHAIQSMSIKSPTHSTPSLQSNAKDQDQVSPFIIFSPSLKTCPYSTQNRQTNESFSIGSMSKLSCSIGTTAHIAPNVGSSPKKAHYKTDNNDFLSTPRSGVQTAYVSSTPATPRSIRTLPSPHETPLPRSMRLTPRSSRRSKDDLSFDTSMFLSPKQMRDNANYGSDDGVLPLQKKGAASVVRSSYVHSPFSFTGKAGVETRSLLEPRDSSSVMNIMLSRAENAECDGSLSDDDSHEPFVLANPMTLVQEQDELNCNHPRPSRRRRMSQESNFEIISTTQCEGSNIESSSELPPVKSLPRFPRNEADEEILPSLDCARKQLKIENRPPSSLHNHEFAVKFESIESCSSFVGLQVSGSPSMIDPPKTPPITLEATSSSKGSTSKIRMTTSDVSNVHLTIACMAAVDKEDYSPTFMTCRS